MVNLFFAAQIHLSTITVSATTFAVVQAGKDT